MATTTPTPFPPDIEREILLRLPSKSLQRFTCVCKSWLSLITNPSFISSYNHHHRSSFLLLHQHPFDPFTATTTTVLFSYSSLSSIQMGPTPFSTTPFNLIPKRLELLNTEAINGVVSALVYSARLHGPEAQCELYLWNPSTGERLKTPVSEITGLFDGIPIVSFNAGLGFDEIGQDYKILRVVNVGSSGVTVEIYSLRENMWRGLNSHSHISSNTLWASSVCTFLNGVGYWGAYKKGCKVRFFILGFDFGEECFKKIGLPAHCVDGNEMRYHSLWVYRGLLAINVLRFGEFDSRVSRNYIWVMMAHESFSRHKWVKLFSIDLEGGPWRPVTELSKGELLLTGEGDYVSYDCQEEVIKNLDLFDVDAVIPCVESLVSFRSLMNANT